MMEEPGNGSCSMILPRLIFGWFFRPVTFTRRRLCAASLVAAPRVLPVRFGTEVV